MCNACGFFCCAIDTFTGCGCDHCPNSECWPDDEDEFYCEEIVSPAQSPPAAMGTTK